MVSNLLAMASNLYNCNGLQPSSDGLQPDAGRRLDFFWLLFVSNKLRLGGSAVQETLAKRDAMLRNLFASSCLVHRQGRHWQGSF